MSEEILLLSADGIYRWEGPKSKSSLVGTKLGRLLLTDERLVFLSSGGNDILMRGLKGARGRHYAGATDHLDATAIEADGSLSIPLTALDNAVFVKKMFRNYLSIRFKDPDGGERAYAFMDQYRLPGGKEWQDEIERARGDLMQ